MSVLTLPCPAVLFDVDGTLVDSTPLVERAARRWAREYGVDADAYLSVAHGRRTSDAIAGFLPPERVREATERLDALEAAGVDGVSALPGARALLAAMNGLPWAMVTSMDPAQLRARTEAAGVPLPPVVVTASDVPAGKPDPAGYLLAARRLGVDPRECVVVEDAPAGVRAGRAAGATVVAVTTSHDAAELAGADLILPGLAPVSAVPGGLRIEVPGLHRAP
ncbi:HAD-IA family hydrolase [Actinomadura viridis]|uniref:HAD-IA family hydrolase n=1 Tax=Actinomadura viridis TaxID=58110 RepID=UPI00367BC63B